MNGLGSCWRDGSVLPEKSCGQEHSPNQHPLCPGEVGGRRAACVAKTSLQRWGRGPNARTGDDTVPRPGWLSGKNIRQSFRGKGYPRGSQRVRWLLSGHGIQGWSQGDREGQDCVHGNDLPTETADCGPHWPQGEALPGPHQGPVTVVTVPQAAPADRTWQAHSREARGLPLALLASEMHRGLRCFRHRCLLLACLLERQLCILVWVLPPSPSQAWPHSVSPAALPISVLVFLRTQMDTSGTEKTWSDGGLGPAPMSLSRH